MINKINKIFQDKNFICEKKDNFYSIHKRDLNQKYEYFIIREVTSLDNIIEKQSEYLDLLKEHIKDKEVEKNSTLLVCFKTDTLPLLPELYKKILEIEENPYFFRKLVFPYTQNQLEQINDINDFEDIIKDTSKFEAFKDECKKKDLSNSLYEVISQLYIKFPFLKLPVIRETKNIILSKYKDELQETESKVLAFIEEINIDEIIEVDDFFKKLEEI